MSGGGTRVFKGGMRANQCMFKPEEVKGFMEKYDQENQKLASLRHNRCQMQEALQLTKKEISEFEFREKKCEMDISSTRKQLESFDERLKTLKVPQLSSGEKSKVKELQKLIASRSDEFLKVQTKHHQVDEQVRELHAQIMNIGGDELKEAKDAVDESNKKCEELRRLIKSASLNIENFQKNSKKAEANAKKSKDEYAITEKMLTNLKEEHAKLDDKAERVLESYNKLKKELEDKDKVLVELRQKRDAVINHANALKSQEVDLVTKMEERTNATQKKRAECTKWGNQLVESRKEHGELPHDILGDLRQASPDTADDAASEIVQLARKAITTDLAQEELKLVVRDTVDARLLVLAQNLQNLKPDLKTVQEFRDKCADHKAKLEDYELVHNHREELRRKLDALRQQRLQEFLDGFSVISMKLKEMYQMITLGGDAELELVDTMDPFSEGINFSVRPPKKSWKQITNLSGGEKTLSSLSLVFALHHYRPTPLYFMDEIDAALDFRNVSIIANYIKQRTKNAQFIVISLRNHMFELADLLVGVYKTQDVSKSVAINPSVFEAKKPALRNKDANSDAITAHKRPMQPIEGPPAKRRGKENLVSAS
jgi:structural maintenance of chromosome 4